ncbi:DUF5403 family protein [Streptomyces sp. NPDC015127]|uniref:DUF5403 family protein n=1 Tax=Streptomyces sp. NPDC015127 TaxID=3364939 RepID=UPI0036FC577E
MAKVYLKTNEVVAKHADVQDELERRTFEVGVRAEQLLIEHRQDGHVEIDIEHGDIDYYVVLSDERGQKAALSIEYGREAGEYEVRDPETGEMVTVPYGAMEGLFILARASHLPKKKKGKVKLD